ncbi:T9SS type A sorting domain-containing protein [Flavobacterium sp. Fl-77]|uniref:T9SS type A sorting domain-containing protein n=1 Tax=Flavobacterium flavipigmentatum TaxID=2893884 RepID=A0AAJ2VWN6_9FLAO|nr:MULTISPECIES: T9SS type A sorting domain-containing protein [unclassified Flavobacterium]MDX6180720.1 T9SS type A sorting domain-containing protein [Flavobacterium sp. Fl-33]MDX6184320.1 T9SS type A sorting domain-containing protein [Flavobacterium sp. Fl-77]UFH39430.1 T9SS type A sorting domain-containing protein [Flavobacterium sp. F-70]
MKRSFLYIVCLMLLQFGFAQNKLSWQGYFSFNEIKDISEGATAVFAASENALFSKNATSNLLTTTTTVEGLSGQTISAVYHSEAFKKTIVGYENGLLIVINETDGTLLKKVDIINKQLPSNLKKINHFMEHNGLVYVSCDFGIVQFNLTTSQFGDTYFIGENGVEISVKQTAFFNGFIFAATSSGIRRANSTSPNLIDFSQWPAINNGEWSSIETLDAELIAINTTGNIHRYNSNTFVGFLQLQQPSIDMRAVNNSLFITTPNTIFVYNNQMVLSRQISNTQVLSDKLNFSCATFVDDLIYIGTKENGLFSGTLSSGSVFENNTPKGPTRNNIFSVDVTPNSLWAVYGDYDLFYNPYNLDSYGISKYSNSAWLNIPYEEVFDAKSITRIVINPSNENQVYASSFFSGLLKIENDVPTFLFDYTNSGLETLTTEGPTYFDVRINGTAFDKSGNLWVTNSRIKNGLKVLRTSGQWQTYPISTILDNPEATNFSNIAIDKNSTKWIGTSKDGVIGFNESLNTFKKMTFGADAGNLPTTDVRAVAVDTKNQLWIGTTKGLRVLSNVNNFQSENQLKANPIIIVEEDLAQELLYEQFITAIVVDGANNKWIGTADSGVFMVSPNGQETKYHFTINNSPLPSNVVNDIKINSATGEVFIATNKGMVSFKGIATDANDDLSNVYVYPNPVRPGFSGTVKIAGLIDKANVKITDIEGNLVHETTAEGGTIEWDTSAFGKYKVASGVYMIFISAQDGSETKVKKVMIIR